MACPEWEAELYKTRVCTSYTCQSSSQEWCRELCHKLKIDFGACNKQVARCEFATYDGSDFRREARTSVGLACQCRSRGRFGKQVVSGTA